MPCTDSVVHRHCAAFFLPTELYNTLAETEGVAMFHDLAIVTVSVACVFPGMSIMLNFARQDDMMQESGGWKPRSTGCSLWPYRSAQLCQ